MVRPENFYIRFDEKWKVMRKMDRIKGYKLRLINLGKLSKSLRSDSSQHLSVSTAISMLISSGHRGRAPLTRRSYDLPQGRR